MADIRAGRDVDVLADLHSLPGDWTHRFDAVIAVAVFEHLERPWIAAKEVVRVMRPGAVCYIGTHQTFPLHGHPSDFFRFSKEALSLIFADAGLQVIDAGYEHRAQIVAPDAKVPTAIQPIWNSVWPSYRDVHLFGQNPVKAR